MDIEKLIKEKIGTIVDVQTTAEFVGGSAEGSINIPLQQLESKLDELKTFNQPLVLCCASGGRSRQATQYLSQQGIECVNAGSWLDVNYYQTQSL